ncbi:MAG: hypothetical protein FJX74_01960 [Armatimonadetes bacterium]|nr:hypothetical protein [Armatimonadota bacterium]
MEMHKTPKQLIHERCRWCLNIAQRGRGWDCRCPACALYPAMPWRGRDLPKRLQPQGGTRAEEGKGTEALLKSIPPRRPARGMIGRYCRQCKTDGRGDCTIDDCVLYPYRPMQPGGPRKRQLSEQQLARSRASLEKARAAASHRRREEVPVP